MSSSTGWRRCAGLVSTATPHAARAEGFLDGAQVIGLIESDPDAPFSVAVAVAVDEERRVAVLSAGRWSNENQLLMFSILAAAVIVPVFLLRMARVRLWLLNRLERLPVLGDWLVQADIAAWARVMAALSKNRVELTVALELASAVVRMPQRQFRLRRARQAVIQGSTLAQALQDEDCLNDTGYNLVRVGEKTGALDAMLLALSSLYTKQGQQRMKKVLLMIEPIAILLIGSAIGTLIIAIILAITSANEIAF